MLVPSQSSAEHVNGNRNVTQCKHGHPFDVENTYLTKGGRRLCRTCHRIQSRKSISTPEGKAKNRARAHAWQANNAGRYQQYCKDRRVRTSQWLNEVKSRGCSRCGEKRLPCLDFHHRDPSTKSFDIGVRASAISLETLQAEVAKCDVICSNCHRVLHASEKIAHRQTQQESVG